MYGPTDLKKNVLITLDGQPYKVIEYSQKVMGRGGSIVNVRVKNLITGALIPKTFKGQEKIEPAEVTTKKVQYLYKDEDKFYFMDPTTFEQYELSKDLVGDSKDFMKDGDDMEIQFYNGSAINLTLPKNLWLEVTYTENAVKGDTSTSVMKDATLETGVVIKVPAFIKTGDIVSVDTETYAYTRAGAVQCGFCIPGMVISTKALLDKNPEPTLDQVKDALKGNICRCTGYIKIFDAVMLAARIFSQNEKIPKVEFKGLIGENLDRVDAVEKTLGTGKYADDFTTEGLVHGSCVRTPY
ncbi:MAG: elongation factor P, partial [Candidatus Nanosyncoccus sp.]